MKKTIKFSLLFLFAALTAFINPLKAQDATKELGAFAKKFEENYNKKNDKALKDMYTKDAVRTNTDGKVLTGNEAIRTQFEAYFKDNVTIVIKQDKVTVAADGSATAMGTYHVTGTSAKGEKVDRAGAYNNTLVKENGKWKISKSVLTAP